MRRLIEEGAVVRAYDPAAGEHLRPQDWLGGALIVVATMLASRWEKAT